MLNFSLELYENSTPNSKKPSADDLFPTLIYLILNSNPDNLYSNIELINIF